MKVMGLFLVCLLIGQGALALSELETELADFQVQLKRDEGSRKSGTPLKSSSRRTTLDPAPIRFNPGPAPKLGRITRKKKTAIKVASAPAPAITHPYEAEPVVTASNPPPTPYKAETDPSADLSSESVLISRPYSRSSEKSPFIFRLTALGFATISTFNGGDSTNVTSSVANPYNGGPAGGLLADFNLGSPKIVLEAGFQSMTVGSYTGYDQNYATYFTNELSERLTLNYLGAPISIKYMFSGQYRSSLFVKLGVAPSYLYQSQYETYSGNLIQQNRFGQFNTFDVLLTAGAGFSLRVWNQAHLVIDGGFYQGVLPVSKYFDIYNTGFRVGGGFSYLL